MDAFNVGANQIIRERLSPQQQQQQHQHQSQHLNLNQHQLQQIQQQLTQSVFSKLGNNVNFHSKRSVSATGNIDKMSRERERERDYPNGTNESTLQTLATSIGGGQSGTACPNSNNSNINSNANTNNNNSNPSHINNAMTFSGNPIGSSNMRGFRSQSPTDRRSRDRNRMHIRTHGSDQGGLLAYSSSTLSNPTGFSTSGTGAISTSSGSNPIGSTQDSSCHLETNIMGCPGSNDDQRLSGNIEDFCYQSFASDELDQHPTAIVLNEDTKKAYRQNERISSLQTLDRLNTKIQCTKESIRKEQTTRDDNVNEYLKLAASADKQQLQRIKAVFEKKNQKSAHTISQLQKKLDNYTKRVKDLQNQQYSHHKHPHRQPREMLRDVGQGLRNVGGNIRDGITGFSGSVMSKPREFAHLIKNKFGSADNINHISESELVGNLNQSIGVGNTEGFGGGTSSHNVMSSTATATNSSGMMICSSGLAGASTSGGVGLKVNSENGSECSSVTSESLPAGSGKSQSGTSQYHAMLKSLLNELNERKIEIEKLTERIDHLETVQKDFTSLTASLESERYRSESLEEQINDLTELHQNEIENLKQTIADMEEKVQYQSDERLQDVNDILENCQTRISKMEHLSQQQYVTVEGIENSNARALVVKLINVVLIILQVVLLMVATAAGIIMPFLKTRVRVLTTFLSIFIIICIIRQWPDVRDIGAGLLRHLKQSFAAK